MVAGSEGVSGVGTGNGLQFRVHSISQLRRERRSRPQLQVLFPSGHQGPDRKGLRDNLVNLRRLNADGESGGPDCRRKAGAYAPRTVASGAEVVRAPLLGDDPPNLSILSSGF